MRKGAPYIHGETPCPYRGSPSARQIHLPCGAFRQTTLFGNQCAAVPNREFTQTPFDPSSLHYFATPSKIFFRQPI